MKKDRGIQVALIAVLAVAVLFMSIGFAAFSQNIDINGTVTAQASKWSIHLDSATYQEASGSVAATSKTINDTTMTYAATLERPGDYYEFTIDVINDGTFNANLNSITLSTLSEAQAKFLTYTVTYAGTDYTATTNGLSVALNQSTSATAKVRVLYIQPDDPADLPSENVDISLTASLGYQQAA